MTNGQKKLGGGLQRRTCEAGEINRQPPVRLDSQAFGLNLGKSPWGKGLEKGSHVRGLRDRIQESGLSPAPSAIAVENAQQESGIWYRGGKGKEWVNCANLSLENGFPRIEPHGSRQGRKTGRKSRHFSKKMAYYTGQEVPRSQI